MTRTATLLNDLILPKWPRPTDPFACAFRADRLEHAAGELARLFNEQYHTAVSEITAGGLTSPDYELRFPVIPVRRVDTDRLRCELPAAYDHTAHLRATDAEHILGRDELYDLCRNTDPARIAYHRHHRRPRRNPQPRRTRPLPPHGPQKRPPHNSPEGDRVRWYHYPELADRETLLAMLRAGLSVRDICTNIGCTKTAVASAIRNHGIQRPFVEGLSDEMKKKLRL